VYAAAADTKRGMMGEPCDDEEQLWADLKPSIAVLVHMTCLYIVFIDIEGDVDWKTKPAWDNAGPKDPVKHFAVLNDCARIETTPCDALSPTVKLHFKRLIAEAYARSFAHEYEAANSMLGSARDYVRVRSEEVARTWYLEASIATTAIALIVALSTWALRFWTSQLIGSSGVWLVLSMGSGALGALLSVIVRSGKLQVDCAAGRYLHRIEGASRVLAGSASGFLTALAVMSGIFLGSFVKSGNLAPVMLLASFVGGTTERFASSIIARVSPKELADERTSDQRKDNEHDS
jgi:hypothetical protein